MSRRWDLPLTPPAAGFRCGVEQEYQVTALGRQVDFRTVVDGLTMFLPARDPGDPRARRLPYGTAITADGWEAELVTAPSPVTDAGLGLLQASLRHTLAQVSARLPRLQLTGFSTHLNVSVPDDRAVQVAETVAQWCLPALHALAQPIEHTGYLVRPRRGRLEVGTDFLDGPRLLLATAIVAGCVRALLHGVQPPAASSCEVVPSREKFGFFVSPENLAAPSAALTDWAARAVVSLGLPPPNDTTAYARMADVSFRMAEADVGPRVRGRLSYHSTWLTWSHVVWCVRDSIQGQARFAVMPVSAEAQFLELLDQGHLDSVMSAAISSRSRRVLLRHAQTDRVSLWTDVRPGALVPAERRPDGSLPKVSRRRARRDWQRHRNGLRRMARSGSVPRQAAVLD